MNGETYTLFHKLDETKFIENLLHITTTDAPISHHINANNNAKCTFTTIPEKEKHQQFFREAMEIILTEAVFNGCNRETKVVNWMHPEELKNKIDLKLKWEGETHKKILSLMKTVINYSVKTGHPHFLNQLYSGRDPYALVGQWLSDSLNAAPYTYEMAPVFTLMEKTTFEEIRKLIGFETADGVFAPGGSVAIMYALNCARFQACPDIKKTGMFGQKTMVIFTSEDSHYSILKTASLLGFGTDNVIAVKCDDRGKMIPRNLEEEIEASIKQNALPIMVCATSGTTVLGAFDPLNEIADICSKHKIWLHVDAAWGGGVLVSKKHRILVDGIERANSVTWNFHKLMGTPLQCSVLLVKDSTILQRCHESSAQYLFQKDKFYGSEYDTGDKYFQCGRNSDVLKLWLMWKAKGTEGLAKHVDRTLELAHYFADRVSQTEGFKMVLDHRPEFINVCFWYIPPRLRSLPVTHELQDQLHKIAPQIKEKMMKKGSLMVSYQPLRHMPNFFRFVIQNSGTTHQDMDFIIEEINQLGQDL